MDQQANEEERPEAKKAGRPRNPVGHRGPGRPRKHGGGIYYQPRGLRAPKTKFTQPPTEMKTRTRTGDLQPKDYRLTPRQPNTLHDSPPRGGRGRPRGTRRPSGRSINGHEDEDEGDYDDPESDLSLIAPEKRHQLSRTLGAPGRGNGSTQEEDARSQRDMRRHTNDDDYDNFGSFNFDTVDPDDDDRNRHLGRGIQFDRRGKRPIQVGEDPGDGPSQPPFERQAAFFADNPRSTRIQPDPKEKQLVRGTATSQQPAANPASLARTRYLAHSQEKLDKRARILLPEHTQDRDMLMQLRIHDFFPSVASYLDLNTVRGRFWDEGCEEHFSRLWPQKDTGRFEVSESSGEAELELWKMMFVIFRRIPLHLFTYGLKLGSDCYLSHGSLMMSAEASYLLQRICAHPIWGDDIDTLRYVLQMAVDQSIEGHIQPIGAHPCTASLEQVIQIRDDRREIVLGRLKYQMWLDNKPDRALRISSFIGCFNYRFKLNPAPRASERSLFILTTQVMKDLVDLLDDYNSAAYPMDTIQCVEHFSKFHSGILHQVEPRDVQHLTDIKWALELCELRDLEIRQAIRRAKNEDQSLYDIPHTSQKHDDEAPLYHHHSDFCNNDQLLSVWRGEVIDPKRDILQKMDRLDDERAKALNKFTEDLVQGVLLRDEPANEHNADASVHEGEISRLVSEENPAEYRSPSPVHHFYLPTQPSSKSSTSHHDDFPYYD
ncbi:hypothetical protein F5Y07DRAFT_409249 [Xylaria sp. FL0933]|nr:hypothetical protein F5Y07DRAFT_409249 [Xylaria sp. FL0933]